jgi:IclR family pca regulon transcriptional regulator
MSPRRTADVAKATDDIVEPLADDDGDGEGSRVFVRSLERGLSVLLAFDAEHPELTLSDVARLTGLDRAAARRFLYTFVGLGYMRVEGRHFSLRPKLLELGYAYLSTLRIPEVAQPHLRVLSDTVHESSYVSINEDADNVCVAHVPVRRIWTATITVGTRLPALATASGRVLMAANDQRFIDGFLSAHRLPQITSHTISNPRDLAAEIALVRKQGWAFVDQELEEGLRVVAAPIHDPKGKVIAAVSVSTLAGSSTRESCLRDMLPPVQRAAAAIEEDLAPVLR